MSALLATAAITLALLLMAPVGLATAAMLLFALADEDYRTQAAVGLALAGFLATALVLAPLP